MMHRGIAGILMVFVLMLAFTGCMRRPKEVSTAERERDKSVMQYVENDNASDDFVLEKLRKSEKRIVNMAYAATIASIDADASRDLDSLKGNDGKLSLTPGQIRNVMGQINAKKKIALDDRDRMYGEVDKVIDLLLIEREKNKLNLAVALKLNEAVQSFDESGVDMSAAQRSIDGLFRILQKFGGKGKRAVMEPSSGSSTPSPEVGNNGG